MAVADLELDLDVFAGPFDLLLTLVLREEIDLLEVELAEVVLAYLDHLEARGELDLEVATEFLVLIAALLELKSRLMLPREDDDLLELEPGEAAEELLARMLEATALPARRRDLAGGCARGGLSASARRRCPPRCAGPRSEAPEPASTRPRGWAGDGRAAAHPPPIDVDATSSTRASRWPSAWPTCARCCARALQLRRGGARAPTA